jgi:formylmethanofuran dehydrogenase subunit E
MNYYMTNKLTTIEPEGHSYRVITPQIMNYQVLSDKRHDELVRCQKCHIKYDIHILKHVSTGKFICKYCIKEVL